ncbi:hypothetical protein BDR07DRAFT_1493324 [Suillus spraguei]|nr:hypothetical protein BDR07DRAFT_1493324 [Suillus spraguei]
MPPKGRRSGGKKTGTSAVGSVANLQLDTRPVRAEAPENDLGKETQRLDTLVAKCKAGIAWLNILTFAHRFKFGIYNNRPENETETNKFISVFKTKGIVPMKDVTAIPIIISKKRIGNCDALVSDFSDPDVGYNDVNDDDAEEDQDEDVIRQLISKKTKGGAKPSQPLTPSTEVFSPSKATGCQDKCADDDNEPRDQTTPKAQMSAPKPRPIPRKKRQASPVRAPVEDEAHTSPSTSEDTVNTQYNSSDVLSNDGRQDNEALVALGVMDDTTHDTDIILGDATLPNASDTTVVYADPSLVSEENMAADKTVLLASQTSSLSLQDHDLLGTIHNSSSAPPTEDDDRPKGCATDDTTWFEQEDVDELATSQSSRAADPDASVEELLATPGPESSKLVPTQPLTQLVEEVSSVVHPATAPAPAPPVTGSSTTKRPRTHTGASSGSSTSGHGKKSQKKKPRIWRAAIDAQDTGADEVIIIPGM